jgi:hypothetical protein
MSESAIFRNVSLSTPAWEVTDLSVIWSAEAQHRGGDIVIPYSQGVFAGRRFISERRILIPMVVYSDFDASGAPHPDHRTGLQINLDALKRLTRPGLTVLAVDMPDGSTRSAPAFAASGLAISPLGPGAARCVMDLIIPGGVLRDTTATTGSTTGSSLTIDNAGTAEQNEATLTFSGSATSVVVVNTSHPNTPTLTLTTNLATGTVVVNTGAYTVLRGSTNLIGSITPVGHPNWMPLVPGSNVLTVTATGGTCTLAVSHYAPYL